MSLETSKKLIANSQKIMNRWEERARLEIQAATQQESLVLRDALQDQLLLLADVLASPINRSAVRVRWDKKEATRLGKLHGLERAIRTFYTLEQLIFELHILRQVICEVLEEENHITNFEREIITCAIEQSVNDAATEFSNTHDKAQQKIFYTLAHDLRTPLTAAKITAQQLQRKLADSEFSDDMINRIVKNMDRIDLMIKDLLSAGMLEAGEHLPLVFKECDLNTIVNRTVEDLNYIYNNRFKYVSNGKCKGKWSEMGLQRLIENLATNAIKYGSADTDIVVTLNNSEDEITLSVHNEGSFISQKDKAILFEQYRRASSTKEQTGWGLGLTVVQTIAKAHNGYVELESIEGKGTTFIVKFPKSSAHNNMEYPVQL